MLSHLKRCITKHLLELRIHTRIHGYIMEKNMCSWVVYGSLIFHKTHLNLSDDFLLCVKFNNQTFICNIWYSTSLHTTQRNDIMMKI